MSPDLLGDSTNGAFGLLTARSATLGSSRVSATTTVNLSWKTATTANVKGIKILVCTNPSDNVTCVAPTGASFSGVSLTSVGGQLAPVWSGASINAGGGYMLTKPAGDSLTAGVTETVNLAGFVNPSVLGTFYFRVITYMTTTAANVDSIDFGAIGVSTARTITVQAEVGEALLFRVANTITACDGVNETHVADPNDPTSDLVTLAPNPMTIAGASTGTAQFCANSNAQGGYTVTYADWGIHSYDNHAGFWNGAHEFPAPVTNFTSTPNTEQFGFNLADTMPTGAGGWTLGAGYAAAGLYSYNDSGSPVTLVSTLAPTGATIYTVTYKANVSATTQGGVYRAHQMFVCTATY